MSQPCAITTCKRPSRALCYCCQQSVCLQHLKEHNDLLLDQLNPLVDQINDINDRLKAVDIQNKVNNCQKKLKQWRDDCHRKIDAFFEQKFHEINRRVTEKMEKQREEIEQMQSKIAALIREEEVSRQDIESLTSNLRKLEGNINKLDYTNFNIEIRSLVIDDGWFHCGESTIDPFDLSKISPVCQTIDRTKDSFVPLASNNRFVLMHQTPDLCLIDRNLNIVHRTTWNYEKIRDMCWSSSLVRFIIVAKGGVFSFADTTMSVDKIGIDQKRSWFSGTCSDTSLFISTYKLGSSIVEYNLLPTIEFIKEWKSPHTCQVEECISDMKYNRESLALLIINPSTKMLSIELRNSKSLERLWSSEMNITYSQQKRLHCCLVGDEGWLIVESDSERLIHITKDGKLKSSETYKPKPWSATVLDPNIIVISTGEGVNFHKF